MEKILKIINLLALIRGDNNLIKQDLATYKERVIELRALLVNPEVLYILNGIEELLVIVDENNGFTIEGAFKNPYMEAIVEPTNQVAREFDGNPKRFIALINEGHHENSVEFQTYPQHCVKGTTEVLYAEPLRWAYEKYPVFEKNTTMGIFAPGYTDFLDLLPNLKRVLFAGGVTDICLMEAALSTKKYFDQNDRDIEIVVDRELVDTSEYPGHDRNEWNNMTFRFLNQAGVKVVKQYVRK